MEFENIGYQELLRRQEYLVVQGNDLAKAFGNLKAFDHRVLDYCFSMVTLDSKPEERFTVQILDIIKHFGLNNSGDSYKRVVQAFKNLNEQTALYLPIEENGVKGIMMTQLFGYINYMESGVVHFEFSKYSYPYVFDLRQRFYSFHLNELASIKRKYSLILLKLWEANRYSKAKVTDIEGTMEEWQEWFLGEKRLSAKDFKRDILNKAIEEIQNKFISTINLIPQKRGRTIVGYRMEIIDNRITPFE